MNAGLVRALALFVPLLIALVLWIVRRPNAREAAGALLSTLWNLAALFALHLIAMRAGWWRFDADGGLLQGMPLDLLIGWAVLWGVVPTLAFPRASLVGIAAGALLLDLTAMPLSAPLVRLESTWLRGELVAILLGLIPSQLLARFTRDDRNLGARVLLDVALFCGLLGGILPAAIWQLSGTKPFLPGIVGSWRGSVALQLLALPALLGVRAVQELFEAGHGTPIPLDPTKRLVTSGPYAFVRNPMQLSMALLLLGYSLIARNLWFAAAALMSVSYSAGLAAWDEDEDLRARFGAEWSSYRRSVRAWIPFIRPVFPGDHAPARLYLARGCGPCSELSLWFANRHPTRLSLADAEGHPSRDLYRITYEPGDGSAGAEGVGAFARALEHLHLGWAIIGWSLRLPGVEWLSQLLVDAVGGGPRRAARPADGETNARSVDDHRTLSQRSNSPGSSTQES